MCDASTTWMTQISCCCAKFLTITKDRKKGARKWSACMLYELWPEHRRYMCVHTAHIRRICRLVHSRQSTTHIQRKQTNSTFWHQTWWLKLIELWSAAKKKCRCYYGMNLRRAHTLLILFHRLHWNRIQRYFLFSCI